MPHKFFTKFRRTVFRPPGHTEYYQTFGCSSSEDLRFVDIYKVMLPVFCFTRVARVKTEIE